MYVLRAFFWIGVVALFIPFQNFDIIRGDIRVDRAALLTEIEALPGYCDRRPDVCAKARDVFVLMRKDGEALAGDIFNPRTLAGFREFAQHALSADQALMAEERTGVRIRP